jgi:hypothetical protein
MAAYQNSDLRDDAACAIGFGSVYWMYNHQPGSDPEMPGSQLSMRWSPIVNLRFLCRVRPLFFASVATHVVLHRVSIRTLV